MVPLQNSSFFPETWKNRKFWARKFQLRTLHLYIFGASMKKIFVNNNYRRPSQSIYLLNRPSTMQQKERKIQLPESRSCYVRSLSFAVRAFGMESRKLHAAPKATMPTASVSTGRAPQVDRLGLVRLCYNPLVLILQCALHAFNRLLGWWYLRYKSFNS